MVAARTNQEKKRTRGPSGLQRKVIYRCGDFADSKCGSTKNEEQPFAEQVIASDQHGRDPILAMEPSQAGTFNSEELFIFMIEQVSSCSTTRSA